MCRKKLYDLFYLLEDAVVEKCTPEVYRPPGKNIFRIIYATVKHSCGIVNSYEDN